MSACPNHCSAGGQGEGELTTELPGPATKGSEVGRDMVLCLPGSKAWVGDEADAKSHTRALQRKLLGWGGAGGKGGRRSAETGSDGVDAEC